MLFSDAELQHFAHRLRRLESVEPVVCAWRYHGGKDGVSIGRLRNWLRQCRDFVLRQRLLPRPQKGQIVFLSDGPTDATFGNLRAVLRAMQAQRQRPFLVTTHKTRRFLNESLPVDHIDITQLLAAVPLSQRKAIRQRAKELSAEIKNVLGNRDGASQAWLESGLLAQTIAETWSADAGAIVVDAEHEAWRKGFLLGASRAGTPSLMLQHGTWGPMMFPLHVTMTACWGELSRREVQEWGLEPHRSIALGSPRWDHLTQMRSSPSDPSDRTRCGGTSDRPLVLLISNTHVAAKYPNLYDPFFEGVARLLETSMIDVAVKLHPSEHGLSEYEKRIPPHLLSRLKIVPVELGLHRPLRACDVAYHVGSAASLEAILLGVPLLFEKGRDSNPNKYHPVLHGGGDWCTPEDVVEGVLDLTHNSVLRRRLLDRQETFLDLALVNRGRASEAVARYLPRYTTEGRNMLETCCAR
jgi:hypothetical protein